MLNVCHICGKGTLSGKKISHSHRRTPKKWKPNLHTVRAVIDDSPKNIKVCAKCLKKGDVVLA